MTHCPRNPLAGRKVKNGQSPLARWPAHRLHLVTHIANRRPLANLLDQDTRPYDYADDDKYKEPPMATTTPITVPVVPVTPDTGTPDFITHAATVLLVVVPLALAWWHPHKVIPTGAAQAAVIIAGIVAAGLVHGVWLVQKNGLTKVGLAKTVSQEESWLRANWQTIRTEWAAAQPAIAALPMAWPPSARSPTTSMC